MPKSISRSRNNNPTGRNQYSNDWLDAARNRPVATAAVAAASVGAGVFLWSKRNQISEQLTTLSEQISDWTGNMRSGEGRELETVGGPRDVTGSTSSRTSRSTGSRPTSTRNRSSGVATS